VNPPPPVAGAQIGAVTLPWEVRTSPELPKDPPRAISPDVRTRLPSTATRLPTEATISPVDAVISPVVAVTPVAAVRKLESLLSEFVIVAIVVP
jgi:hypothetical protein